MGQKTLETFTDPNQLGLGSTFQQFFDPLDLFGVRAQQAATKAYEYELEGAERARAFQEQMFNRLAELQKPYMDAGAQAVGIQSALVGAHGPEAQQAAFANYMASPEIQYAVDAGLGAFGDSQANRQLMGDGRMEALAEYGQGLAAQDYSNYLNRLGLMSGMGMSGAAAVGGVGTNAQEGIADVINRAGAAGAGSALAAQQAQAQTASSALGAIGGIMGAYGGGGSSYNGFAQPYSNPVEVYDHMPSGNWEVA